MKVHTDCRHYRGDIPCRPHKKSGVHCSGCTHYYPVKKRILIIKLGAIGDVIRTTPLLTKLKEAEPDGEIIWLTHFPDILPLDEIDSIIKPDIEHYAWLRGNRFDWLINLDKEKLAIALAEDIEAEKKSGFGMDELGRCKPLGREAEIHKWQTGLWDDLNKSNTKNYMEEIFEICGYRFQGEEYLLDDEKKGTLQWNLGNPGTIVGLNTGCGGRWTSRLWPEKHWISLAAGLKERGYSPVLLGGSQEDEKNRRIAETSGALYPGHFDLKTFINLVNQTDLVVTAVTMAMHLAIGLKKKLVLFNNIFNKNEFYLYDRGIILEPELECDCFFTPVCPNECMTSLPPEQVLTEIEKMLERSTDS